MVLLHNGDDDVVNACTNVGDNDGDNDGYYGDNHDGNNYGEENVKKWW